MPKLKTHSGLGKVIKKRPGGTIKIGKAGGRHNTGKKNSQFNRDVRKGSQMDKSDIKRLKSIM